MLMMRTWHLLGFYFGKTAVKNQILLPSRTFLPLKLPNVHEKLHMTTYWKEKTLRIPNMYNSTGLEYFIYLKYTIESRKSVKNESVHSSIFASIFDVGESEKTTFFTVFHFWS